MLPVYPFAAVTERRAVKTWREKLKLAESRAEADANNPFGAAAVAASAALTAASNGDTPLTATQDHFPNTALQTAGPSAPTSGPTTPTSQLRNCLRYLTKRVILHK